LHQAFGLGHREQYPQAKAHGDHGRTAVTDEGQWHAHDGQDATDHAHVHKHIDKDVQGHGTGQQTGKQRRPLQGDRQGAHNQKHTHMLVDTHDGLWFYNFWSSLGIRNLKIISIFRNPIDIVYSWLNLDLGVAEKKILNQIPLIKNTKNLKPFYYYKFLKNAKKNKNDVVVDMVGECFLNDLKFYEKIKNKKRIFRLEFNNFAENTDKVIKKISLFLNLNISQFTRKIMIKERLPRKVRDEDKHIKLYKIKNLLSKSKYLKLLELEKYFKKHKEKYKL
jgi:hypothetical protein